MKSKDHILKFLSEYDGVHHQPLTTLANSLTSNNENVNTIINIIRSGGYQTQAGAAWVLKGWVDNGSNLSRTQANSLLSYLPTLSSKQTLLLILQMLPSFKVSQLIKNKLFQFLKCQLSRSDHFIRIWAYYGLYVIACQYDEHVDEVKFILSIGMNDASSSVQEKAQSLLQKF